MISDPNMPKTQENPTVKLLNQHFSIVMDDRQSNANYRKK